MPSYFAVLGLDNTPTFEPVGQWAGVWSGVAKVEDEAEAERLRKLGRKEITEQEFESELKKKALSHHQSQGLREVAGSAVHPALPAAASTLMPFAEPPTPPPPAPSPAASDAPSVEPQSLAVPSKVPPTIRRRSNLFKPKAHP